MLSLEQCPGLEEVEPEEVHDRRKCKSGGSARAEGVCRWRKGRVAGGRSGVGHRNVLSLWWTNRGSGAGAGAELSWSWIYQPELGYITDQTKGVAGLKPE